MTVLYSAAAMIAQPWTWQARIAVIVPAALALFMALRLGWHRASPAGDPVSRDGPAVVGMAVWGSLLAMLALFAFLTNAHHPRWVYPTFSHLTNLAFDSYPVRVAGFVVWLGMGWYLVRR